MAENSFWGSWLNQGQGTAIEGNKEQKKKKYPWDYMGSGGFTWGSKPVGGVSGENIDYPDFTSAMKSFGVGMGKAWWDEPTAQAKGGSEPFGPVEENKTGENDEQKTPGQGYNPDQQTYDQNQEQNQATTPGANNPYNWGPGKADLGLLPWALGDTWREGNKYRMFENWRDYFNKYGKFPWAEPGSEFYSPAFLPGGVMDFIDPQLIWDAQARVEGKIDEANYDPEKSWQNYEKMWGEINDINYQDYFNDEYWGDRYTDLGYTQRKPFGEWAVWNIPGDKWDVLNVVIRNNDNDPYKALNEMLQAGNYDTAKELKQYIEQWEQSGGWEDTSQVSAIQDAFKNKPTAEEETFTRFDAEDLPKLEKPTFDVPINFHQVNFEDTAADTDKIMGMMQDYLTGAGLNFDTSALQNITFDQSKRTQSLDEGGYRAELGETGEKVAEELQYLQSILGSYFGDVTKGVSAITPGTQIPTAWITDEEGNRVAQTPRDYLQLAEQVFEPTRKDIEDQYQKDRDAMLESLAARGILDSDIRNQMENDLAEKYMQTLARNEADMTKWAWEKFQQAQETAAGRRQSIIEKSLIDALGLEKRLMTERYGIDAQFGADTYGTDAQTFSNAQETLLKKYGIDVDSFNQQLDRELQAKQMDLEWAKTRYQGAIDRYGIDSEMAQTEYKKMMDEYSKAKDRALSKFGIDADMYKADLNAELQARLQDQALTEQNRQSMYEMGKEMGLTEMQIDAEMEKMKSNMMEWAQEFGLDTSRFKLEHPEDYLKMYEMVFDTFLRQAGIKADIYKNDVNAQKDVLNMILNWEGTMHKTRRETETQYEKNDMDWVKIGAGIAAGIL